MLHDPVSVIRVHVGPGTADDTQRQNYEGAMTKGFDKILGKKKLKFIQITWQYCSFDNI